MTKDFYVKTYGRHAGLIVAVCDKEICGKTLKADGIEVFINPRFYNGQEASSSEVLDLLKRCYSANLFGEKVVELAKKAGLVDSTQIKIIGGIPHAQLIRMVI